MTEGEEGSPPLTHSSHRREKAVLKDEVEKAYEKYRRSVIRLAAQYARKHHLDQEEILQEANLLFARACESFDQDKACLHTWIHSKIDNGLKEKGRAVARKERLFKENKEELYARQTRGHFSLDDVLFQLSGDARFVVKLLLDESFPDEASPQERWSEVVEYLFEIGWEAMRIVDVQIEIKEVMRRR